MKYELFLTLFVFAFITIPAHPTVVWNTPFGRPYNTIDPIEKNVLKHLDKMEPFKSEVNFSKDDFREIIIKKYSKVTFYFKVVGQFLYGYQDSGQNCQTAGGEVAWFYMAPIDSRHFTAPSLSKSEYKIPSKLKDDYWTTYGNKITTLYKPTNLTGKCSGPVAQKYMQEMTKKYSSDRVAEFKTASSLISNEMFTTVQDYYNQADVDFDMEIIKKLSALEQIEYFIPQIFSKIQNGKSVKFLKQTKSGK